MTAVARPVLRYPGGKYRVARWIIQHFPPHEMYVELFGGGGSVLMHKPRSRGEVYNDLYGDVVNVFRVLRDPDQAARLERALRLTPFAYDEYKAAYAPCDDPVESARRTIFRSFSTIGSDGVSRRNSGFRGLKNRETTVTAALEWSRYPEAIRSFTERLNGVLIENRDALHVMRLYDRPSTLFYVDPPYVRSSRSQASAKYVHEFSDADHVRLAEALKQVQGMVIVSGYASPLYTELYAGWHQVWKSATAQNGKPRVECLWLSPNIHTTLL